MSTQRTYQQSDCEKTPPLDAAFNVLRHVNSFGAERLLAELDAEIYLNAPDSPSYTSYADAATCAATAAPAPLNELADSTRVIEYVAPTPVAGTNCTKCPRCTGSS